MIAPWSAEHVGIAPGRLALALLVIGVVGACALVVVVIAWALDGLLPDEPATEEDAFGGCWELLPRIANP